MNGFYVTGTDTGAGKSAASAALLLALRGDGRPAVGMKPVASGCEATPEGWRNEDALRLIAASEPVPPYELVNPVALPEPTAPQIAAAMAGVAVTLPPIVAAHGRLQALAGRDGPAVLATVDTLRSMGLSAAGTLEEMAGLLQQMAVQQGRQIEGVQMALHGRTCPHRRHHIQQHPTLAQENAALRQRLGASAVKPATAVTASCSRCMPARGPTTPTRPTCPTTSARRPPGSR